MPGLSLKNMPDELHARLKESARMHRRSMTQEALEIIEQALQIGPVLFPDPAKPNKPVRAAAIRRTVLRKVRAAPERMRRRRADS